MSRFERRAWRRTLIGCLAVASLVAATTHAYAAAGDLDPTFNDEDAATTPGTVLTQMSAAENEALAVARQTNGKIVAGGFATDADSGRRTFAIARYTPNGSLDTDFGGDGKVTMPIGGGNAEIHALVIQGTKIVVAGYAHASDTTAQFALAR